MYNGIKIFSLILLVFSFFACTYNKKELPAPEDVVVDPNAPSITYTNFTKNVMDNNCVSCHFSGGQTPFLTSYSEVQSVASRIKVRAIDGSPTAMPPSGLMPQTTLDTLQMWLDQGALQ
jgi:cytochrome c5